MCDNQSRPTLTPLPKTCKITLMASVLTTMWIVHWQKSRKQSTYFTPLCAKRTTSPSAIYTSSYLQSRVFQRIRRELQSRRHITLVMKNVGNHTLTCMKITRATTPHAPLPTRNASQHHRRYPRQQKIKVCSRRRGLRAHHLQLEQTTSA